jgi:hypothetical protein
VTIKPGDYVVSSGRLGVILRHSRMGRAEGWVVQGFDRDYGTGTYPHFHQGHLVQLAVVGRNVCRKPLLCCFCGLVHAPDEILPFLDTADCHREQCTECRGTGWVIDHRIGCVACKGSGSVEVCA